MKLRDAAVGRDNNFNLLRMAAAFAVLVTHGFALRTGDPETEPLRTSLGMSLGAISVDVFFVTSGFLVTASMLKRGLVGDFVRARVLRIYPAALVMCALTVFVLGPIVTTVGILEYFSSVTTWKYLVKCATMIGGVSFELPGVFEQNAFPRAVNGSLWSMPWELRMYALLVLIWTIAGFGGALRATLFRRGVVALAAIGVVLACVQLIHPFSKTEAFRLLAMFFIGGAFHVLADRVRLPWWGGAAALGGLLLGAAGGPEWFPFAWIVFSPYLVLWCAYVPAGPIRAYNRMGDYSYGVYIFAFPVQQLILSIRPDLGMWTFTLATAAVVLVLAALSWHLVEKPCMRLPIGRRPSQPSPA